MSETSSFESRPWYPKYLLGLLMLVSIIAYSDRLILGFLIEPIKEDLGIGDTAIGLLNGLAFSLFYAVMGLPLGRLIDIYPRNIILAACIAIWSVCTMACGLAVGTVSLFLARCGLGSGEAAMNPSAVSLIASTFPKSGVVRALSLYSMGVGIGGGLAIILGGQLIAWLSSLGPITIFGVANVAVWRVVFILIGVPGLVAALVVLFTIRDNRTVNQVSTASSQESIRVLAAFLLSRRAAYGFLLAGLVAYSLYNLAVLAWYPAMLARTFEVSTATISLVYGIAYLVSATSGSLLAAPLVSIVGRRFPADATVVVLIGTSLVTAVPAVVGPLMPTFWGAIACFLVTMQMSAIQTSMGFSSFVLLTPERRRGVVIAIYVMMMNLVGGALGSVLIGLLSDHVFGPKHLAHSIALVAAIAVPVSLFCFVKARPAFRAALAA